MTKVDLTASSTNLSGASIAVVAVDLERAKDPELARLGAIEWDDEDISPDEEAAALGLAPRSRGAR